MKLSTLFTASIVALTGFDIAIAKSFCAKKLRRPWAWRWEIHIDEVDNIADRCDRLSKAVREQKYCEIFIPEGCGKNPYDAFEIATENKFGTIAGQLKDDDWWFNPDVDMVDPQPQVDMIDGA